MKKIIAGLVMTAGLLLLVSCGPKTDVGPIEPTGSVTAQATIVVPTCTPEATLTPSVTPTLQPAITEAADVTIVPTTVPEPTTEPGPTETPAVTPTEAAEPTAAPTITMVPEPTTEPTVSPSPTTEPEPTATPSPTPIINPDTLVNHGWQKTISIDEKYTIVFPERFRESTVVKENNELLLKYTCPEEAAIEFRISYLMKQTLQTVENQILGIDGILLDGSLGEKRVVLTWHEAGMIYHGILLEEQYPQTLLGGSFGEEEWITGVMQVVFAYPEERHREFEAAEYGFYVKQNGEE